MADSPFGGYNNTTYAWLAARARNAVRRRALVSITTGVVFVAALIGLILVPREATRTARIITTAAPARADTTAAIAALDAARRTMQQADSALAVARRHNTAVPPPPPPDTLSPAQRAERDSLSAEIAALTAAMERVDATPLPPAFRQLAEVPALRDDPRVRSRLDSLDQVDKLRAPFSALGAGDPIYVSLTAKVNELGRGIRDAASSRRAELRTRLVALAAPAPAPVPVPTIAHVDTTRFLVARLGGERAYAAAAHALDSIRAANALADSAATHARELANVGAPPIAMLAAALVIALAVGFATAVVGELRHPRVAHVREGEAVSGTRVLTVIEPVTVVERARRESDVHAPPLVDIVSQSYRTLYLHLAATGASVPVVTVTGHLPGVVATVATNLAASAAYEGRSTLLVDADAASNAIAAVLRIPPEPGLQGILSGRSDWARSIVSTTIGRDRPLDVLPGGASRIGTASPEAVRMVRESLTRMERRYDFIVIAAPTSYVQLASNTIIPAPDVVICARVGETRVADLRAEVKSLRGIGRVVHGIVLWDDEAPRLAVRPRDMVRPAAGAAA